MPAQCSAAGCHLFAGPSGKCKRHVGGSTTAPRAAAKGAPRAAKPAKPAKPPARAAKPAKPAPAPKTPAKPPARAAGPSTVTLEMRKAADFLGWGVVNQVAGREVRQLEELTPRQLQTLISKAAAALPAVQPAPKRKPAAMSIAQANAKLFERYGNLGPAVYKSDTFQGYYWLTANHHRSVNNWTTIREAYNNARRTWG